jgi:hypothetical protein
MSSAKELREQATLLLALAISARENGDIGYSDLLIRQATRYLDQTQALETAEPPPAPLPAEPRASAQQQQQQPKKADDKE